MEEKRLGLQQNFQDCKKNFKLDRGPKTSEEIEKRERLIRLSVNRKTETM